MFNIVVNKINNLFLEHPRSLGESYWQHLKIAMTLAVRLGVTAGALICHAILPNLFKTFASERITELYDRLQSRRNTNNPA
jgi:hypothetical protein